MSCFGQRTGSISAAWHGITSLVRLNQNNLAWYKSQQLGGRGMKISSSGVHGITAEETQQIEKPESLLPLRDLLTGTDGGVERDPI